MSAKFITGKLATILKFSLAGIVLLFAALAVYVATFDINNYRDRLQSQASTALGRNITLQGPLSMGISLTPTVVIEKLHIANPDWASRPYFASIDVIELEVELIPMLREELKIASIKVKSADILLETNKDGEDNWHLTGLSSKQQNNKAVDIESVEVKDSTIALRTAGKITKTLMIDEAKLTSSFSLVGQEIAYELSSLKGKINKSDFSGTASFKKVNNRPLIIANIQSDKFFYHDVVSKNKPEKAGSDKHTIPDIKLPISGLQSLDAKLDFSFGKFIVGDVEYDNLVAHVDLHNGKLVLDPINVNLSGGKLTGKLQLVFHEGLPSISINAEGTDVDHGGLLETFGVTDKIKGKASIKLDFKGAGASTRTLLAKSNGHIEIVSGKGRIDQSQLNLWASDLLATALTSAWVPKKAVEVNCTIAKIDIRDGIATSDILLLDTERLTVAGSGKLNLSSEELNLLFIPSPKSPSFISLAKPVQVTGYLSAPKVAVTTGSKTRLLGGLFTGFANPAALLLLYGDKGRSGKGTNPCLDAVNRRDADESKDRTIK